MIRRPNEERILISSFKRAPPSGKMPTWRTQGWNTQEEILGWENELTDKTRPPFAVRAASLPTSGRSTSRLFSQVTPPAANPCGIIYIFLPTKFCCCCTLFLLHGVTEEVAYMAKTCRPSYSFSLYKPLTRLRYMVDGGVSSTHSDAAWTPCHFSLLTFSFSVRACRRFICWFPVRSPGSYCCVVSQPFRSLIRTLRFFRRRVPTFQVGLFFPPSGVPATLSTIAPESVCPRVSFF